MMISVLLSHIHLCQCRLASGKDEQCTTLAASWTAAVKSDVGRIKGASLFPNGSPLPDSDPKTYGATEAIAAETHKVDVRSNQAASC